MDGGAGCVLGSANVPNVMGLAKPQMQFSRHILKILSYLQGIEVRICFLFFIKFLKLMALSFSL